MRAHLLIISLAILSTGCAHQSLISAGDSSTVVGEILDQVNVAIAEAKASQPAGEDGPEISSVEVDLQLGTSTGATAGFPLGLLFPTAQANSDELHKISLTFTPKPMSAATSTVHPDHALTTAIQELYRSVAKANPAYQFQKGSMQIQCTLEAGLSVSNSGGSGGGQSSGSRTPQAASTSSPVTLVPIQVGVSSTRESIQTITLNFAPHQTASPAPLNPAAPPASNPPGL